jgi:hypothetical protein
VDECRPLVCGGVAPHLAAVLSGVGVGNAAGARHTVDGSVGPSGGRAGAWIKSALSGYSASIEPPSDAPGTADVGAGMGDAALPTAAGAGVLVTGRGLRSSTSHRNLSRF